MQTQRVEYATLVELLNDRAKFQPNQTGFTFLKDGETVAAQMTYGELDQRAQAIALQLLALVPVGSRALLVYPYDASLEFIAAFFGCLYAGIVAVPGHPPRNRSAFSDLQARLTSAQAAIVLTTKSLLPRLNQQLSPPEWSETLRAGSNNTLHWLPTDQRSQGNERAKAGAAKWSQPALTRDSLAFLQYTSGSTGAPKGVMVTHGGILHNQQMLKRAFGHTEQSVGVGWLPLFHDMGLIGNALQAVYLGASCVLMSPVAFVQKPVRWLQAISHYRATTSGAPNFAYDLLCRYVPDSLPALDLSSWEVAFSGAEPIRAETIDRFVAKFAPYGFRRTAFYPCYGMAEATLFVSGGHKTEPPQVKCVEETALAQNRVVIANGQGDRTRTIVGCGKAWLDSTLVIVDPESRRRCLNNQVGEIWISGAGVGKGYWNQPEETIRTFRATLETGEGPFLRTGDLGFLAENELFITGRLHDVMVFWGFNHYPEQIERTVEPCHPAFQPNGSAAFSVAVNGTDRLVIVQEVARSYRQSLTASEVVEAVRWAVFDQHFVDVYAIALLKPGSLPKTSSGKVQRHACRAGFLAGSLDVLDEWRSPQTSDIPALIKRYLNPMTHLNRYSVLIGGRLRRWVFGALNR